MEFDISNEDLLAFSLAYGFLHQVFYVEPNQEFIAGLAGERIFKDWLLPETDAWTDAGLRCMTSFSEGWLAGAIREEELRIDYERLFGPADPILAYPYESAYAGRRPDKPAPVREAYQRVGLVPPNEYGEPEDHIGLELSFLVHLCMQAMVRGEDDGSSQLALETQRDFLVNHLLRWTPAFLEQVVRHAEMAYYRGAAWLCMGCLVQHARLLGLPDATFIDPT